MKQAGRKEGWGKDETGRQERMMGEGRNRRAGRKEGKGMKQAGKKEGGGRDETGGQEGRRGKG